ncbi:MAG: ornithine cyclodeaminase [Gammaproteobacteria bacterium RIFCSPHIGHO2_12_FULL_41_15]|nr:MAG: ornithine cyclodeaminase [Gammaproteobacteria bacterium RIFCSPHIGHO2_12_FULL_41_15]
MPKIISLPTLKTLIAQIGLNHFIQGSIDSLRQTFNRWHDFNKSPRHVIHYPHGVIELMPIADNEFYSVKYVNGHPFNVKDNKLTVVAIGLLAEVQSGYPLMLSEMTLLTAIRTAATSALASGYLARKNSQTLAIIGNGSQAEFQVLAHHVLFDLQQVNYFDIDPNAMKKFANNLRDQSFTLKACNNTQDCIKNADIIVTATADKQRLQILEKNWIQPGMHINGIGGDCAGKTELDPEILHHSKIVVEYLPQTKKEGEIQHLTQGDIYAELWELVQNKKPGRDNETDITLFDSVGFAMEDFAILKYVYEQANALGLGETVELVPTAKDPKDLFGLLR